MECQTVLRHLTGLRVEPRRQLDALIDLLLAAPAAKLMPHISLCIPLNYLRKTKPGFLMMGIPGFAYPSLRLAEVTPGPMSQKQHGRQQLRVKS